MRYLIATAMLLAACGPDTSERDRFRCDAPQTGWNLSDVQTSSSPRGCKCSEDDTWSGTPELEKVDGGYIWREIQGEAPLERTADEPCEWSVEVTSPVTLERTRQLKLRRSLSVTGNKATGSSALFVKPIENGAVGNTICECRYTTTGTYLKP